MVFVSPKVVLAYSLIFIVVSATPTRGRRPASESALKTMDAKIKGQAHDDNAQILPFPFIGASPMVIGTKTKSMSRSSLRLILPVLIVIPRHQGIHRTAFMARLLVALGPWERWAVAFLGTRISSVSQQNNNDRRLNRPLLLGYGHGNPLNTFWDFDRRRLPHVQGKSTGCTGMRADRCGGRRSSYLRLRRREDRDAY